MPASISGTGVVTKIGTGTLTLTGDSTYAGTTTISAGTLQLGNGGTTGSVVGNIVDTSALVFNRSDALTYGGVISSTGTLTQAGRERRSSPAPTPTRAARRSAPARCKSATGERPAAVAGNITDNSALIFNRSNSLTYAGVVSGTGTLAQAGSGHDDPHRRQHLLGRNDDQRGHAADRQRRHGFDCGRRRR